MKSKVARLSISVFVLFSILWTQIGIRTSFALGTPQITKIEPSSPSPVGTCIKVRAKVDWDSEFRSMRMRFGSEGWQESAEIEFERTFCTSAYGPGWYTIRVEVARIGDNDWSSPTVTEASYELTASSVPPTSTPVPSIPKGPSISEISFNPSGSAEVGKTVVIHIKVDSSNPGAIRTTVSCGGVSHVEHTVPEFDNSWYTSQCGAGGQSVTVCARDVNDPNWENPSCASRSYTLTAPPPPPTEVPSPPTASFSSDAGTIQNGQCTWLHWQTSNSTQVDIDGTIVALSGDKKVCPTITKHYSLKAVGPGGVATRNVSIVVASVAPTQTPSLPGFDTGDVIKIGYDVFVIVNGERRHVPNPDTLDALGISQSWIDNQGWTEEQLKGIPQGADIPDVNKDKAGFDAFKNLYFPNTQPIVPKPPDTQSPTEPISPSASDVLGQQTEEQDSKTADLGTATVWCEQVPEGESGGFLNWLRNLFNIEVQARTNSFTEGQCTWYAAQQRDDIFACLPEFGADAHTWDDHARKCGFEVNGIPEKGDIVVWEKSCGGEFAKSGHVAYVEDPSYGGNTIVVNEANLGGDGQVHLGSEYVISDCMSFIHQPGGNGQTGTSGGESSSGNQQEATDSQNGSFLQQVIDWFKNWWPFG